MTNITNKEKVEEVIVKNLLSNDISRWCIILTMYQTKKNNYYVVGACRYFNNQLIEINFVDYE